jgi:hypothetical protein
MASSNKRCGIDVQQRTIRTDFSVPFLQGSRSIWVSQPGRYGMILITWTAGAAATVCAGGG